MTSSINQDISTGKGAEAIFAHPSIVGGPYYLTDDEAAGMFDDPRDPSLLPIHEPTVSDRFRTDTVGAGAITAALNATSNLQNA